MKIIKIELENINALKGKWTIDLTNENYKINHNQFVICGDTGSGKTTILDGIVLALYGRTPREDVSKSKNEIMCKGQASCMAAVTYECSKGTFRSRFYQRRARLKPDGSLQEPECTIQNLVTGEIIDKVKSVSSLSSATTKIIDLDYHQFCRSILLAQGSFDQFLKGDEREKADILAKLNGTGHYKAVAVKLREKADQVIRDCEEQLKTMKEIQVLTLEEIQEKQNEIQQLQDVLKQLEEEKNEIDTRILWREAFDQSKKDYDEACKEIEGFREKKEIFESQQQPILDAAQRAKECEGKYDNYSNLKKMYGDQEAELKTSEDKKATSEKAVKLAEENLNKCKKDYDEKKEKEEDHRKLWQDVRLIDQDLGMLKSNCDEQFERKKTANQEYKAAESDYTKCEDDIKIKEKRVKELEDYLSEHELDEKLSEQLSGMEKDKKSIVDLNMEIQSKQNKLEKDYINLEKMNRDLKSVQKKLAALKTELQQFVSSNYLSISEILRKVSLVEGKPCPVCGAIDHPFVLEKTMKKMDSEEVSKESVVTHAVQLSEDLESKTKEENNLQASIKSLEEQIKEKEEDFLKKKDQFRNMLQQWNNQIKDWSLRINEDDLDSSMTHILKELNNKKEAYKGKNKDYGDLNSDISRLREKLNGINLKELKVKYDQENETYEKAYGEFEEKKKKRSQLFGEKNVDEEETDYYHSLRKKEDAYKNAQEDFAEKEKCLSSAQTDYENKKVAFEKSQYDFEKSVEILETIIKEKGFANIQEFEGARLSEDKLEALKQKKSDFETEKVKLETQYNTAKKKYEDEKEKALTTDSLDELKGKKQEKEQAQGQKHQRIGELTNELRINEENEEKKEVLRKKYEQSLEQLDIYKTIKESLGKKDGSDFEVFVQKLAMENLLHSANGYISQILPDYTLVKKTDSMDILLHDLNHPDSKNDRPVTNMSGGETFAISLALALGIAEVASHKMQVESLFLDEGFGTLSGEPLQEAIHALKRLQSTGKMLGIITHVEPVIHAFDQKIRARKAHGFSTLEGSGITRGVDE